MFVNNIELRTPPVQLPFVGNNLGFVFFHDMGNVFDTANHIISGMLTFNQPSIADCSAANSKTLCNFNYDSQAIGMGIRYKTPVGPVRFDLGYAVNATRYPVQEDRMKPSRCDGSTFISVLDRLSDETHFVFRDLFRAAVRDSGSAGVCR